MTTARPPLTIRMHADDNVAIVANDGGLPAGLCLPAGCGAAVGCAVGWFMGCAVGWAVGVSTAAATGTGLAVTVPLVVVPVAVPGTEP